MNNYQEHYYRLSAKAKIWQGNKLIFVKENGKSWDLPGGGIKHNETIESGLRRELVEEIGYKGEFSLNIPKIFKMIDPLVGRPLLFLAFEYSIPKEAKLSAGKNTEIGLFSPNEIPDDLVNLSEDYTNFIKEA